MKNMRELMRDPRAALGIGLFALAMVGYRVRQAADAAGPSMTQAGMADMALGDDPSGADQPRATPPPVDPSANAGREVDWSWQRNPFLRSDREDAPPPHTEPHHPGGGGAPAAAEVDASMTLRGTVVSDGVRVAILGNRVVPVGETLNGWTVEQVGRRRVVIRSGTETRTLELVKPAALEGGGNKGEKP